MVELFSFSVPAADAAIVALVAILIGMSKTGVHGAGMIAVPLLASVFGGQLSSGVMLPMLCIADVMGVWYYHRHASWKQLSKLFPWAILGTILGTTVGDFITDEAFKIIMASIIGMSVVTMIWLERNRDAQIPHSIYFVMIAGVLGGFTSMVGNLAGSVMAVYLLSMRLPKNEFIGTSAWFFMVMNWIKIPFHVFWWETVSWNTFLLDLSLLPLIVLGAILGIFVVRQLAEKTYRWFIILMTIVAAVLMLLR